MAVDVIQRGEALAIFEENLIIHFQQISRAAALHIGWEEQRETLEIYRRVNETTKNYPWSVPTTEEKWHTRARRCLDDSINHSESSCGSMEKRPIVESSS